MLTLCSLVLNSFFVFRRLKIYAPFGATQAHFFSREGHRIRTPLPEVLETRCATHGTDVTGDFVRAGVRENAPLT